MTFFFDDTINLTEYNSSKTRLYQIKAANAALKNLATNQSRLIKVLKVLAKWTEASPSNAISSFSIETVAASHLYKASDREQLDRLFANLIWIDRELHSKLHEAKSDLGPVVKQLSLPNDRVLQISQELRCLRNDYKVKSCKSTLVRIKELVRELHSIISLLKSKQRKYVYKLKVSLPKFLFIGIRRLVKRFQHIIFKNLPDFSGCEEEAVYKFKMECKPVLLIQFKSNVEQTVSFAIAKYNNCIIKK